VNRVVVSNVVLHAGSDVSNEATSTVAGCSVWRYILINDFIVTLFA